MSYKLKDIMEVVTESTYDMMYQDKIESLNERFKNENFDSMTRNKYIRFRQYYQSKRDSILKEKDTELKNLSRKYEPEFNRIDALLDEEEIKKEKIIYQAKYNKETHKVYDKYRKKMNECVNDFKYRAKQMNLKWCYIANDDIAI